MCVGEVEGGGRGDLHRTAKFIANAGFPVQLTKVNEIKKKLLPEGHEREDTEYVY